MSTILLKRYYCKSKEKSKVKSVPYLIVGYNTWIKWTFNLKYMD